MKVPEPNACGACDVPKPHGWQWTQTAGMHQWVRPTDAQILDRMKTRRANKENR